jgi:hypothetical protein
MQHRAKLARDQEEQRMCVNCEWQERTANISTLAADGAIAVLMNSPRHTPDHKAAFDLGTVIVLAVQGAFQAWRTGNPEPLARLASMVRGWGRDELDKWPFQFYQAATGKTVQGDDPAVSATMAEIQARPGQAVGPDELSAVVAKMMTMAGHRDNAAGQGLAKMWEQSQSPDGSYPGKVPMRQAVADMAEEYSKPAADPLSTLFARIFSPDTMKH